MPEIRFAVIGLGCRGYSVLKSVMLAFREIEVVALCDFYTDRVDQAFSEVRSRRGNKPFCSTDYRAVLSQEDVDAVYVATAWESHIEIAVEAMRVGKAVALEVGGAYSIEELCELVRTQEQTGAPFVLEELLHVERVLMGCVSPDSVDTSFEILAGNLEPRGKLTYDVKLK